MSANGVLIAGAGIGGLTAALRILTRARELEMRVMLGCMIETAIVVLE